MGFGSLIGFAGWRLIKGGEAAAHSVIQSFSQSVNQSISQSVNQSISQSIIQLIANRRPSSIIRPYM
jgi:hypothetical protein